MKLDTEKRLFVKYGAMFKLYGGDLGVWEELIKDIKEIEQQAFNSMEKIIGDDEWVDFEEIQRHKYESDTWEEHQRNQLRAEQRIKLAELRNHV